MRSGVIEEARGERCALGVLLVHGIGRQRRGDTLVRWGETLLSWFDSNQRRWALLRDVRLDTQETPPHLHIEVHADDDRHDWIVAESWWADRLATPTLASLLTWSFRVVPWTFAAHASQAVRRNAAAIGEATWYGRVGWTARLVVLATAGVALALATFPVVLALLTALTLLALVPIPATRNFVRSAQRLVAGTVGDSMVLIESPVQAEAVLGGVRRDIQWLADRCDHVVVVGHSQGAAIALETLRSYGREERPMPPEVHSLFTFGSGIDKLSAIRHLRDEESRWVPWAATAVVAVLAVAGGAGVRGLLTGTISGGDLVEGLATIALVIGVMAAVTVPFVISALRETREMSERHRQRVYELMHPPPEPVAGQPWDTSARGVLAPAYPGLTLPEPPRSEGWLEQLQQAGVPVVVAMAAGELFRNLSNPSLVAWLVLAGLVVFAAAIAFLVSKMPPPSAPSAPGVLESWIDVYASADPVPNGPLEHPPRWERSEEATYVDAAPVWNLRSFVSDHSAYWQNADTFVTRLVGALLAATGAPTRVADDGLHGADARRRRRTAVLKYVRLTVVAAAGATLAALWSRLDDMGDWAVARMRAGLDWLPFGLEDLVPVTLSEGAQRTAGLMLAVAVAVAAYYVLYSGWRRWDRAAAEQAVRRM